MEIRHAEETDLVSLVDLFETSIETQGPEHYSPEQVHAWASRATEASFQNFILGPTTFVAIDDSGPLGFCGYGKDGHITSLYIRPDSAAGHWTGAVAACAEGCLGTRHFSFSCGSQHHGDSLVRKIRVRKNQL